MLTFCSVKNPLMMYSLCIWASLVAQTVHNLPAMQETRVQSLSQEDPLEKGMTTQSSFLASKIPRTEELDGLTVHVVTENQT